MAQSLLTQCRMGELLETWARFSSVEGAPPGSGAAEWTLTASTPHCRVKESILMQPLLQQGGRPCSLPEAVGKFVTVAFAVPHTQVLPIGLTFNTLPSLHLPEKLNIAPHGDLFPKSKASRGMACWE